ncbi:NusG antitermination factor [Thermodesulfobacterium geofontis OPF15]|jgi:transcriptional antiterminator NusG|uniref:Transcription termination/antitermination protein NusG n=1 Tax=Thermodesulfobacterium geofontis (strain OPF15) TaxID=795359 RepID=F8C2J1_THEGP|nr:transcription termination/antitermination protein NusG [Thermodesulfobacterium geofontis]AEH22284.1 NusG antitermination factor [Thermodesulfobacterium geofontis OPF15]
MSKIWYSVQVWSGLEEDIKQKVEKLLEEKAKEKVEKIFVPPPKEIEIVFSPEKQVTQRFYSGYFLIYGELDEALKEEIKKIKGVIDIIGGDKLYIFRSEEVERLISQLVVEEIKPKPRYQFMQGDRVRITEGPFANFIGIVDEVKPEKGKVKVLVSIFGRETPVEIEFAYLQKI